MNPTTIRLQPQQPYLKLVYISLFFSEQVPQGNIVWRMTSGVYSTASSAVGMGVGGVKWVAGKSYDVGTTVVSNVKVPKLSSFRRKDKKE
jgi:hypothetical protein